MFSSTINLLIIGQSKTSRTEPTELYFAAKVASVMVIAFDSPLQNERNLEIRYWKDAKIENIENKRCPRWVSRTGTFAPVIAFIYYFVIIIRTLSCQKMKFEIGLGIANFASLCIWISKVFSTSRIKLVYYCLDFYPKSAKGIGNRLIHLFYRISEKVLVSGCDLVWDISPTIADGRAENLRIKRSSYEMIEVPGGWPASYEKEYDVEEREPGAIGFIGTLSENQGLQLAIEKLEDLAKIVPDVRLHIVGQGPYREELETLVASKNLNDNVIFYGYLPEREAFHVLRRCQVGIGLWTGSPDDTSRYADPGKPKLYALLGLPVIITMYTPVAVKLEKCDAGIVVPYDGIKYLQAATDLLTDKDVWRRKHDGLAEFKKICLVKPILNKAVIDSNLIWARSLDTSVRRGRVT